MIKKSSLPQTTPENQSHCGDRDPLARTGRKSIPYRRTEYGGAMDMKPAENPWWQYRLTPAGVPIRIVAFLVDALLMLAAVGSYFWFIEGFRDTAGSYLDP